MVRQLTRESLAELRALIMGLRPADLARDGLTGALAKEVEMLRQVHAIEIDLELDPARSPEIDADRDAAVVDVDPCLLAFDRLGGSIKFCKF